MTALSGLIRSVVIVACLLSSFMLRLPILLSLKHF
uniref:Uncharacterized protein n=1 Tax=Rhizophora mucronata TaxID=61149 RepID=A0A2P2JQ60_RHIMU